MEKLGSFAVSCLVLAVVAHLPACVPEPAPYGGQPGDAASGLGGEAGSAGGGSSSGGTGLATGGAAGSAGAGGTAALGGAGGASTGACPVLQTEDPRIDRATALGWLNKHNEARARYRLAPLEWDADLAAVAQAYAERGAWDLGHNPDRSVQYASRTGCTTDCPYVGENIHFHSPWNLHPLADCMNGFLAEEDAEQCNAGGTHYLAIMNAATTRVGCGGWIGTDERFHLVCNYAEGYQWGEPFPLANCGNSPEPFVPEQTACYSE